MAGWIKISRDIVNHWLWQDKPFSRGQAWIDLLLMAAWKERIFFVRGIRVEQHRGDVCLSVREMCERWHWSNGKVIRFLNELETAQQITQQKSNVINTISIVNYDKYQMDNTTDETPNQTADETPNGTPNGTTIEELKNNKEVKPLKENQEKKTSKMQFDLAKYGDGWDALIGQWLAYKSSRRQSYKSQASVDILFKKLQTLSNGDLAKARMIVEQSIGNNWSGLFPLKDVGFGGGQTPVPGREVLGSNFENRD